MAVRLGCRVSPELMGRKKRGSAKFRSRKVCGFSLRHEPALVRFTGECARIVGHSEKHTRMWSQKNLFAFLPASTAGQEVLELLGIGPEKSPSRPLAHRLGRLDSGQEGRLSVPILFGVVQRLLSPSTKTNLPLASLALRCGREAKVGAEAGPASPNRRVLSERRHTGVVAPARAAQTDHG
jgi:hypothetical protein